jgi:hypothetical protein
MISRKSFGTVICAILISTTSSAATLGQNDPAAYRLLSGNGEDSPSSFSESISESVPDQSQCAGSGDLGDHQSYCSPRWTASADFIILNRSGGGNQTLVDRVPGIPSNERVPGRQAFGELFSTPGAEALDGNDFQQGFCGGPRVGLIRHGDSGYDLEFSYFQIDGWRSDRTVEPNDPDDCLVMRAPGHWVKPTTVVGG